MLQTEHPGPITTHEIHVLVELQDGRITVDDAIQRIHDALTWVEGVGKVETYNQGAIREVNPDDAAYGHGV